MAKYIIFLCGFLFGFFVEYFIKSGFNPFALTSFVLIVFFMGGILAEISENK